MTIRDTRPLKARLERPLAVRLPAELRARVDAIAKVTRRSRGDVLREALERHLGAMEWEQRILSRSADVRASRVHTVALEDLNAELGEPGQPDLELLQ